jgi:hypothetical protein
MLALIFLFLNVVASFLKPKRWGNRAAEHRSLSNVLYLASIWVIPTIVAITFHEAAHGFVAHLLGDETAWRLGRVSFNPIKHIDPIGTILLPGFLLLRRGHPPSGCKLDREGMLCNSWSHHRAAAGLGAP